MLRGCCTCTISELATHSPFVSSSLSRSLTPLFPLDASHSSVSPLFPLDTQNRGVPPSSNMTNRSISESSPARSSAAPHFSAFPLRSSVHSAPPCPALRGVRHPFFYHCLSALRGASSLFSGLSSSNRRISAENAKSINITLRLSIIVSNIVGAPTFLSRDRTTKDQQLIDPATVFSSHCGLSTMNCFSPLTPIIPVHPRHSPVSPIIPVHTQKQGGGAVSCRMCSPITLLFSSATLTTQLSTIVGAPTFPFPTARHSERSLRSEVRFCIARLLCDESLFSWVSTQEGFLASLGMTGVSVARKRESRRSARHAARRPGQPRGDWC